ncbi:MAG: amidohydrolase family protein [Oscillospiraceae bacterium]|nr:amidohydrolase family protein [Oscillospiraceae bacterium]
MLRPVGRVPGHGGNAGSYPDPRPRPASGIHRYGGSCGRQQPHRLSGAEPPGHHQLPQRRLLRVPLHPLADRQRGLSGTGSCRDLKGCAPYLPREAFTVKEALDSFTKAGAYASFEENIKGQIKSGHLSDFVILGKNPFLTAPDKLKDIPILQTWLDGERVW